MNKTAPKIVPVLVVIIIILSLILMVATDLAKDRDVKEWDTVPVTITRIERTHVNSNKNRNERVYVSYEYDGVQYFDILLRGDGVLMESGDQYYAKVNPHKPTQVSSVKNILNIISDYSFVVFFAFVCITVLVVFFSGDKREPKKE
ncbi:MAG: DUF3592 domain-containing protein [Lachnospiraceae bacterium]|nr:DUF3592 domain-containing protein [Lachnospiraceae bacterium]